MRNIWDFFGCVGDLGSVLFSCSVFLWKMGLVFRFFFEQLFANSVSRFFAVDLAISSLAFLLWSFFDSKKNNVSGWWVVFVTNLCVGLSLALQLYFYKRSKYSV